MVRSRRNSRSAVSGWGGQKHPAGGERGRITVPSPSTILRRRERGNHISSAAEGSHFGLVQEEDVSVVAASFQLAERNRQVGNLPPQRGYAKDAHAEPGPFPLLEHDPIHESNLIYVSSTSHGVGSRLALSK